MLYIYIIIFLCLSNVGNVIINEKLQIKDILQGQTYGHVLENLADVFVCDLMLIDIFKKNM